MAPDRAPSPRFTRPAERPNVTVNPQDIEIFLHVYRHRVIDAHSIYALFPTRSEQGLSKRLRKLWLAGYLDRPQQQNAKMRLYGGSDPYVYALGREGARILRDQGFDLSTERWTQKNREIRGFTIQHALSTTRFLVQLELATRAHQNALLHYQDELAERFPQPGRTANGLANTMRARFYWKGALVEEGTAPDKIVGLQVDGSWQYLFIEIDQGTETIEPGARKLQTAAFWRETSFLKKMAIYAGAFTSREHLEQFGFPHFRVLTVTTTPDRMVAMQAAYQTHLARGDLTARPGLFLFTDWQTINDHDGTLLDLPLQNGAGKSVTLARS